jgi:hypothetical protein
MAKGLSGAAAGSGAVPMRQGAGIAGDTGIAAAQRKQQHGKTTAAAAAAAAAAAPQAAAVPAPRGAAAKRVCKALPPFSTLRSVTTLWSCYSKGNNGSQPWEVLEQQGKAWRHGERRR